MIQKTLSDDLRLLEMDFMPLTQMMEVMAQREKLPFNIYFSFEPYLNSVRDRLESACPNTKGALIPVLEGTSKYIESGKADLESMFETEHFKTLVSLVVPSMFFKDDISFIAPPFTKKVIVGTRALRNILDPEAYEIRVFPEQFIESRNHSLNQAYVHILNTFYNQNVEYENGNIVTLRNKKTGVERHYQITFKLEFVELIKKGELPELSQADINYLIENMSEESVWMEKLPPELFEFRGFSTVNFYDISELEVISQLKQWLNECSNDMPADEFLAHVTAFLKSYLNRTCIQTGFIMTEFDHMYIDQATSLTQLKKHELLGDHFSNGGAGIYGKMASEGQTIVIPDLESIPNPGLPEKALLKQNIKSIILAPIFNAQGKPISVMEIGCSQSNAFNAATVRKLHKVMDVLRAGYERNIKDIENKVTSIIQEKYTSIHPSVQWKFEEVAVRHLSSGFYDERSNLDSIVFHDVYPLYGQADIIGSSDQRNAAIQADLIENLELLTALLMKLYRKSRMPLLDSYYMQLEKTLANLKVNFVSNDETEIVNLITREIHPMLRKLHDRNPALFGSVYERYRKELDPDLNIIYKKRKDFETSVNYLNVAISKFLEEDNAELQQILPHYFEKYKTDGVEYNMYVGQSILEEGEFDKNDLANFRLWQLINTCRITKLVEEMQENLQTPLQTAQLIFVYNHALSIRFRMDEKRFDVDGAYNVRYEILKKRIDKALIKDTGERLTVSGKVAIVYLSDQDKAEYVKFFDYLIEKGLIAPDFEDLELDKLQGAEGLRALRIKVI